MELLNEKEFSEYVRTKYKLILTGDTTHHAEISGHCDFCKRDAYLKIEARWYEKDVYRENYFPQFATMFVHCPSCKRKSFIQTVVLAVLNSAKTAWSYEYYRLYLLPTQEYKYEIADIPKEHPSLIQTISEALFCLENSQFISAAIMFRRGLQILAKDILGAVGKDLFKQLDWLKTNSNKLGISLTNMFHDNSELIRKVGNQGAHPDDDLTLHNFTEEDANALHDLFLIIINEIFILPAKVKALQDDLKTRRKIK